MKSPELNRIDFIILEVNMKNLFYFLLSLGILPFVLLLWLFFIAAMLKACNGH